MNRAAKWLGWTMAAYYVAIATLGTGLHLLPGCWHPFDLGVDVASCCGCPHAASFEEAGCAASDAVPVSPVHTPADCPICRFVATASHVAQAVLMEFSQPLVERLQAIVDPPLTVPVLWAFAARAPPAA